MRYRYIIFSAILPFLTLSLLSCGSGSPVTKSGTSFTSTVSGKVQYEDKEYGVDGWTGNTYYKAVRYATVEIVDSVKYIPIASTVTDSSGNYSVSFGTDGLTQVYVRVISETSSQIDKPDVQIRNLSSSVYSANSSNFTPSEGTSTFDISISTSDSVAGAFNILDIFTSSGEFINSLSGGNPPALKVYWEIDNPYGTYYCHGYDTDYCLEGEGIYVLNEPGGDTDEYDDDVLWHEYGHFAAAKFSKDDSQGGQHSLSDNTQDLRLAWSEGWGNFFPGAVKTWLKSKNLSLSADSSMPLAQYVDTTGTIAGISFDFSASNGTPYIYASNETAVANILWRTMSETTGGISGIWDVFANYIPQITDPVNLETFWDGWLSRQMANGSLATFFTSRSIFYQDDSFENDNSPSSVRKASIGASGEETHYLYKTNSNTDVDIVAFDTTGGVTYDIETYDLKNGADTYLTVLAPDGSTTLSENDNYDGATYSDCDYYENCPINGKDQNNPVAPLSSRITFTPSASGTYYIKVTTSPDKPPSAGKYGTYSLKITVNPQ
jgi:hypothetical protein